jgi:nitroreductase
VIERALDAALIAPNSSNMQTWRIFWVRDPGKKAALVEACLSQGAAKTAQELLVFTADGSQWRRSQKYLLDSIKDNPRKDLHDYYGKLIPVIYGYQWLSPLKWVLFHLIGLFKPMVRADSSRRETAVK